MHGVISQDIQNFYQVSELNSGTNGYSNRGHEIAKAEDPETARIRQAEQQIEILNRFFHIYPAAVDAIMACPDPEEILEIFAQEVINLLDVNCCHIYQWDEDASSVSFLVSSKIGAGYQAPAFDQA